MILEIIANFVKCDNDAVVMWQHVLFREVNGSILEWTIMKSVIYFEILQSKIDEEIWQNIEHC